MGTVRVTGSHTRNQLRVHIRSNLSGHETKHNIRIDLFQAAALSSRKTWSTNQGSAKYIAAHRAPLAVCLLRFHHLSGGGRPARKGRGEELQMPSWRAAYPRSPSIQRQQHPAATLSP